MPVPTYLLEQRGHEIEQALSNLRALPSITRNEVDDEEACPICLLPLESILEEHEGVEEKQEGSSNLSSEIENTTQMTGVVKLSTCGHIFCRKDLAEWIESHHGSCPTCRRTFFTFTPIDEAEYESSDGGEYIPEEDEDYDDFTDGEFDLVASSDFDFDMDEAGSDEQEDTDEIGYTPLARVHEGEDVESGARRRRRISLVYAPHPSDDLRVYASDHEHSEAGGEREAEGDSGGLSYGSDSPSSEGASFSMEDSIGVCATGIQIVSNESDVGRASNIPIDIHHTEAKSPAAQAPGPSVITRNDVQ